MGLENKLSNQGSVLSNLNGGTASVPDFKLSKRHLEYSINGSPNIAGQPTPSSLDLEGVNPSSANKDALTVDINDTFKNGTYKNNLPTGASF
tara:strand:- start:256 stop:531 length:276 start_codon:yes stop_codon:yes gene_type:complete